MGHVVVGDRGFGAPVSGPIPESSTRGSATAVSANFTEWLRKSDGDPVVVQVLCLEESPGRFGHSHNHLDVGGMHGYDARLAGAHLAPHGPDFKASDELGIVSVERTDQVHTFSLSDERR